jgi:hypothetical protein
VVFIDTGAWFALVVPSDVDHRAAVNWFASNRDAICTSNYVVDETLTLLRARGESNRALAMGTFFFSGQSVKVHHLSESDVLEAWRIFERFSDKEWSFTDCTSRALMERLQITEAFAFDNHFRQFGGITVLP